MIKNALIPKETKREILEELGKIALVLDVKYNDGNGQLAIELINNVTDVIKQRTGIDLGDALRG